jgi:WD40 repeat protein
VAKAQSEYFSSSQATTQTFQTNGSSITTLAWSPDGKILASASEDDTLKQWDADTGEVLRQRSPGDKDDSTLSLAWSPDGQIVACGMSDGI